METRGQEADSIRKVEGERENRKRSFLRIINNQLSRLTKIRISKKCSENIYYGIGLEKVRETCIRAIWGKYIVGKFEKRDGLGSLPV